MTQNATQRNKDEKCEKGDKRKEERGTVNILKHTGQ